MSCCLACAAACATPSWAPRLRKHALKTEVLALPEEFVDYLLEDGVVLPDLPADLPMHAMDPRLRNHRCDSDDEFDDAGIPGVDAGTPGEDAGSGGDSVDSPPPRRCFQALEVAIADAIERLGGAVFIALDWSSPQDASWISEAKSIKCTCAGEVFLLLKSSDHIQRDLELGQLLADAGSCGQCHRAAVPYDAAGPTPAHRHRYPHHLVLKPWYSLPPAGIFRCFVSGGNLLAVSQKHTDQHFRDLAARIDTVLASLSAFLEHLRPRKAHAGTEAEAHGALPLSTGRGLYMAVTPPSTHVRMHVFLLQSLWTCLLALIRTATAAVLLRRFACSASLLACEAVANMASTRACSRGMSSLRLQEGGWPASTALVGAVLKHLRQAHATCCHQTQGRCPRPLQLHPPGR